MLGRSGNSTYDGHVLRDLRNQRIFRRLEKYSERSMKVVEGEFAMGGLKTYVIAIWSAG